MNQRIPYAEIKGDETCSNCGHGHDRFDTQRRFGWAPKLWCGCGCTWPYRQVQVAHAGRIARAATFDVTMPDAAYAVRNTACHVCGAPRGVAC